MSHVTCVPLTFFFQQHYYERLLLQWKNWVHMSHGISHKECGALIGFLKKNPEKSIRSQRAKLWYMSHVTCVPLTFVLQQHYYKKLFVAVRKLDV